MRKNYSLTKDKNGLITYKYRAIYHDRDIVCVYHLLCEVGDRYQAWFKQEITRRGWTIISNDAPPPIHWANYVV